MNEVTVYSFDQVNALVNGVPITGLFEGDDVVKISRNDDSINSIVGAEGNALVSISTDQSAMVELKLMPTSPTNAFLYALELAFRKSLIANPFPLAITDFSTRSFHMSNQAVVFSKPKEITYGKIATVRVWQIFCGKLTDGIIGTI